MRDEDKPFVCYKQGLSMKIVPRGGAGWRAFGLWMGAFMLMLVAFLTAMPWVQGSTGQMAATGIFLAVTAQWAVAMIRWMLARSEIIDLRELTELKRERDAARPRGRR